MLSWLDDVIRDVTQSMRTFKRNAGFTAVALLTLGLGIGANTAIFSVVNGVILTPLHYPHPEQLMYLTTQYPGVRGFWFAGAEYVEYRDVNTSFAAVGAYQTGEVNLTAGDRPQRVRAAAVDDHLLRALGVRADLGRLFAAGETEEPASAPGGPAAGAPAIAILSHELWQSAFGGQPMLGRTVPVNGRPHEVIGIMSPGMDLMDYQPEIWLPLGLSPAERQDRGSHNLFAIGRLKDGVAAQTAQAEIDALTKNWRERFNLGPKDHTFSPLSENDGHSVEMRPLQERILGDAGRAIWLLQVAVGLVLLIVCANLASLLLARAETRRHELALRAALGASRRRLVRQFVTEGLLLSLSGGIIGLWIAAIGLEALTYTYPTSLPRTTEVSIDGAVLLFAFIVSVVTGVLFGLAPSSRKRATDLVTALKESGDHRASGTGRHHIRRVLVVGEVAMAVMLVIGAGLLVRTVYNLTNVDTGFERSRRVTFLTSLRQAPTTRRQMYRELIDQLRAVPGVQGAAAITGLPPERPANFNNTIFEHYTSERGDSMATIDYDQFVMGDYFETMGIPIVAGRRFERTDAAGPRVVIVNETLARKIWTDRNPVGERLRRFWDDNWFTVVGVARDVKQGGVAQNPGTEIYFFVEQETPVQPATMNLVLRTSLPPSSLLQNIERVMRKVDPTVPVARLRDMDAVFMESIRRPRLLAQLLGGFAGLALLLAAIGTYGVLSYMVAERRREIGIRIALGASRLRVLALVMRPGLVLTTVGVSIGLAGALALNSLIASLLFGVEPTDTSTIAAVVATIAVVATVACGLPAFRASRLDPNVVLRTN
jgi:predicted permease